MIYGVRYTILFRDKHENGVHVEWLSSTFIFVCVRVSMSLTWYLSEWWMSSEDKGETTGDSPSRFMCTDNSIDWRERGREMKCLLYADDHVILSPLEQWLQWKLSSLDSCCMGIINKHGQGKSNGISKNEIQGKQIPFYSLHQRAPPPTPTPNLARQ